MKHALVILVGSLVLTACLASTPTQVANAPLPTVELISPASGTSIGQGEELEIESRSGDTRGVDRVELWVDEKIYRVDQAGAKPSFHVVQRWRADASGQHSLQIHTVNVDGQTSRSSAIVVDVIDRSLFTATPTNTPTATHTPTATGTPVPTFTTAPPTPTPTVQVTATATPTLTVPTPTPGPEGSRAMVLVPAGTFLMGSNDDQVSQAASWCGCGVQVFQDELYMHQVSVSAFAIDKHETTNRQFMAFANATGYLTDAERKPETNTWRTVFSPGREDHPVVWISWNDANAYCEWAGKRLPTEAEWEKAARGGDARLWPWGSEWDSSRANMGEGGRKTTTQVGSFPNGASPYGVMDLAGNVWEWVNDWYSPLYYQSGADRSQDPRGADGGQDRVLRGGGFGNGIQDVRTANRHKGGMAGYAPDHGFRCARSAN